MTRLSTPLWPARLAGATLELLVPRRCVACDGPVVASSASPFCARCEAELATSAYPAPGLGPRCDRCGKPLVSERGRCLRCRGAELHFDSAYPLFRYDGLARRIILAYKLGSRRSLAPFLASLLAGGLRERYPGRAVIPVPPRPAKLRRKGWDQVELLARVLERDHGVCVLRVLARADGVEQKALDLSGRASNLLGKFRLARNAVVPPFPVLLDDVLTTGATLSECAATLRRAGAERVDAITLAAD